MARTASVSSIALATLPERVSVLETKVDNIEEKLDDIKIDVKDMHDCLDRTRDEVIAQLHFMTDEYRSNATKYYQHADKLNDQQSAQHQELAAKIDELEKQKNKITLYATVALAFMAGAGWIGHVDILKLLGFFGLR
jgi:outer membrane murein-binding lipoprotein Lpp